MGAVYFYHLTRRPLEQTLPQLLGRARSAGWRVVVRGMDRGRLEWLDEKLWQGPEDEFLAHGLDGNMNDALQPIILTDKLDVEGKVDCVISVDGAEVSAQEVSALDRVCILFDGTDGAALTRARGQWKSLTDDGCAAQYWSEESGKWEMKAEK